ncbi:unnamed protein product, partial [Allacma fusca]
DYQLAKEPLQFFDSLRTLHGLMK